MVRLTRVGSDKIRVLVVIASVTLVTLVFPSGRSIASLPVTTTFTAISGGGDFTCALTASAGLKCWGSDGQGQLGNGTFSSGSSTPVDVSGLSSGVSAVAAGGGFACALTNAGGVKCWGNGPSLGDGVGAPSDIPVDVSGLSSGVSAIAAGGGEACALTVSGGVKCWGSRAADGSSSLVPVDISGLSSGVAAIAVGGSHACALTTGGGLKCWGENDHGELGNGTSGSSSYTPVDVSGLSSGVVGISSGFSDSCALTTGGGVKCWGHNGVSSYGNVPVDIPSLSSGVSAIVANGTCFGGYCDPESHTCALTSTGGVKCWGVNFDGELGDGTLSNSYAPVDVSGLSGGIVGVAAGVQHSCALTSDGSVKCWGRNKSGQLGDATKTSSRVPVDLKWAVSVLALAISAKTVPKGGQVTFTIDLKAPSYSMTSNHHVYLQEVPANQAPVIWPLRVNTKGLATISLKLSRNTTFAAGYAGDEIYGVAVTHPKLVGVTIKVTNVAAHYYALSHAYHLYHYERICRLFHNKCPTFDIATSPPQAGFPISVVTDIKYGERWVKLLGGSGTLNSNGRVTLIVPYSSKQIIGAQLRLRATFSNWKFATSRGAWTYFRVTR
jgi:hypothetical protein